MKCANCYDSPEGETSFQRCEICLESFCTECLARGVREDEKTRWAECTTCQSARGDAPRKRGITPNEVLQKHGLVKIDTGRGRGICVWSVQNSDGVELCKGPTNAVIDWLFDLERNAIRHDKRTTAQHDKRTTVPSKKREDQ